MLNKLISRDDAIKQGLKHYFTGKPCKKGHTSYRYTSSSACVECAISRSTQKRLENPDQQNEYVRNSYHKNPDPIKQKVKEWQADNKELAKQINKDWKANNPEYASQYFKEWSKNNPEKISENARIRNHLLKRQIPTWYEEDLVKQIYKKRDEFNKHWGTNLVVDHIIPLNSPTVSGLHCWANLQLLDSSVNSSKGNRYQTDW